MKKWLVFFMIISCVVCTNANAFETEARNAILVDYETGEYLFAKNQTDMIPPASMSKLLTVYEILSRIKAGSLSKDDVFTVSENAWRKGGAATGSSTMFLPIGHKIKVSDLLRGIIIQSGNDACIVAAENIAGSEGNFVDILQSTAESLGMHNTMVANSTGWPHPDHRMSVEDLAILAKHIIKEFPEHYSVFSEKNFTYNNIRQGNRNPLLYSMPEADGLKTGHTEEAGFSLVASAKRGERRLIGVLAGLKTNKQRSEEAERIMNWGFREFNNYKILNANETLVKIPVVLGKKDEVAAGVAENVVKTLRRGNVKNVKVTAVFDKPLKASVNKGDVLGKVKIEAPELSVTTVDLVALETVNKTNVFGKLWYNLTHLIGR